MRAQGVRCGGLLRRGVRRERASADERESVSVRRRGVFHRRRECASGGRSPCRSRRRGIPRAYTSNPVRAKAFTNNGIRCPATALSGGRPSPPGGKLCTALYCIVETTAGAAGHSRPLRLRRDLLAPRRSPPAAHANPCPSCPRWAAPQTGTWAARRPALLRRAPPPRGAPSGGGSPARERRGPRPAGGCRAC